VTHTKGTGRYPAGSFNEAVEFLFNWPPHEGMSGSFKKTRCCELDPPIVARTWWKSGPLCPYVQIRDYCKEYQTGACRIPLDSHEVFYAELHLIDCQNELTPMVRIRHKHFMENRRWAADLPPPDFKLWASTMRRFEWWGKVADYSAAPPIIDTYEKDLAIEARYIGKSIEETRALLNERMQEEMDMEMDTEVDNMHLKLGITEKQYQVGMEEAHRYETGAVADSDADVEAWRLQRETEREEMDGVEIQYQKRSTWSYPANIASTDSLYKQRDDRLRREEEQSSQKQRQETAEIGQQIQHQEMAEIQQQIENMTL